MKIKRVRGARVVLWQGERLLVQTDRRLSTEDQFYRLPGGHLEPGETPAACARRELEEEMGLTITIGNLWYVGENIFPAKNRLIHELIFYFAAETEGELPTIGEVPTREAHLGAEMVSREELKERRFLPVNLFQQLLKEGSTGPSEVLYISDGEEL